MADGEELHELHVDQRRTGGEREGMALARHVGRGAGARVEPRQPAGRDHRHPCRQRDGAAGFHIEAHRACEPPVGHRRVGHDEAGDAPDRVCARHPSAQDGGDGRAGVEDVHIAAAPAPVAGGGDLGDAPALSRPADLPGVHLPDPHRPFLAEQRGEPRIAQPAPGLQRVLQVVFDAVGLGLAEGGGDGHLRHHRGAAAADHVAIGEDDPACPRLGRGERRIHAGAARSDDEHVGRDMGGRLRHRFRPRRSPGRRGPIRAAGGARPRAGRAHSRRRRGTRARRRRCGPRSGCPSARPRRHSRSAPRRWGTPAPD